MTIGKDGEPALDVRTITFETRIVEGDEDKVLRRTMHATSASALQAQAATAALAVNPCCSSPSFGCPTSSLCVRGVANLIAMQHRGLTLE